MVPERDRAPVAIDGRVPNVENRQECAPACADIRSPEEKNIADKIPSTCLAREPASAVKVACARRPMLPERPSINPAPVLSGSCASPMRDACCAPGGKHHCHDVSGSNAPNKWLENKMNSCLLWNSSKLSSGRETETPRNKSRRSNMLSHPRKLLSSSMDGAGKIFYHPARLTHQHIKPARTVGAVRDADGASGLAACRRSDCDRNADCRQDVLRTRQHRCSAGRATGCDA
jgi:hypothetical protein